MLCFLEIIRKTKGWGDKYKFMENYKNALIFLYKNICILLFLSFHRRKSSIFEKYTIPLSLIIL